MSLNHPNRLVDGGAQFLCDTFGTSDAVVAIRKAVSQVFADTRSRIPVDIEALLAKRHISIVVGDVPPGKEVLLKPVPKGFHLIVPRDGSPPRSLFQDTARRFTLAHEIIETFFFSHDSETPVHWTRLPGYRGLATLEAMRSGGFEERLCDYGAGLILVPTFKVGELTDEGARIPSQSSLMRAAVQCSTGPLSLCHRIASYLWVRHSNHAVVGIVKKCPDPNSANSKVRWRFAPTRRGAGYPVGVDINATLMHKFFLPTNKSLGGLGFELLAQWLDAKGETAEPIGEEAKFGQNGTCARMRVRHMAYDHRRAAAVVWFDLEFSF